MYWFLKYIFQNIVICYKFAEYKSLIYVNLYKILTLSHKWLIEEKFIAKRKYSNYSEAQILRERILRSEYNETEEQIFTRQRVTYVMWSTQYL